MFSAPTIKMPRSAISQNPVNVLSWKHGEIVPLSQLCCMVLPGTTLKVDLGSKIVMNTPVRPFAGEIECEINAFFVPMRLLWSKWKQMFGENLNSAGRPVDPDLASLIKAGNIGACADLFNPGVTWNSVSKYLGKPIISKDTTKHCFTTLWKEKAYYLIWSTHYRAAMLQAPFILNDNPDCIGSLGASVLSTTSVLLNVNKSFDYFTTALQEPAYGAQVTLPIYGSATLKSNGGAKYDFGGPIHFYNDENDLIDGTAYLTTFDDGTYGLGATDHDDGVDYVIRGSNLMVDMSTANLGTVDNLRFAVALQNYQYRGVYGGPWYQGQLVAHYGVTPSDNTLQLPVKIGSINFKLNVSQVTAMASADLGSDGVQPVGSLGAISVTGNGRHFFTQAFTEFGVVITLLHTRVKQQSYTQGVLREDTRFKVTDFFSPEFANIGEQSILKKEIFVTGSGDDEVFGYQEAWCDERYKIPVMTAGICDPNAGAGVADPTWALVNKFNTRPVLDDSFLVEDRNLVASRLYGVSSNYDYIGEFHFHIEKISLVPLNSQPGRMDHIGLD